MSFSSLTLYRGTLSFTSCWWTDATGPRHLPLRYTVAMKRRWPPKISLLSLALASGASALALELLWARELALVFGASGYAVTTVLAAFMAGMGLGSVAGGNLADKFRRPPLLLAGVEASMACLGPLLTLGFHHIPELAASILPETSILEFSALTLRFGMAFLLMLPATLLMGASFPLMICSTGESQKGFHRGIAWIYGANTLGGVLGVLGASFFVLPKFGVMAVALSASAANVLTALLAITLPDRRAEKPSLSSHVDKVGETEKLPGVLLLLAGLSGAAVLAGETLWNRVLAIVLPNSTYTFALLLALYLLGLAIGGLLIQRFIRLDRALTLWGWLQILMAGWLLLVIPLSTRIPVWIRYHRPAMGWGRVLLGPLSVGGALILPAALLLGAAWPLLLAAAAPQASDGGRRIGWMGLINALGAALGAIIGGWLLLPKLGFGSSFLVIAALHLLMFALLPRKKRFRPLIVAPVCVLLVMAVLLPGFGRISLPSTTADPDNWKTLYYKEGPLGTVRVLEDLRHGGRSLYVDNNSVIGNSFDALKVVRMLGLLPLILHPHPEEVLVIGFGAGVTTATLAASPEVRHIDAREIVPGVAEAAPFFAAINHQILANPKLRLSFGDGRNYLLSSRKKWDIITCDPIHPLYGSAALYSKDFFLLALSRLKPGGMFFQYLPLHQMPPEAFQQAIYTFAQVFPHARIAFSMGHGLLIGSDAPIPLDWEEWKNRLHEFQHPEDLLDSCLSTPAQIATVFQLKARGIQAIARPPASTDAHPFLEFLEPAAYDPGCWKTNARHLIEAYDSPLEEIRHLPAELIPDLQRLIAGKRLLLFAQLELEESHPRAAFEWLQRAQNMTPGDPEIQRFSQQFRPRR